MKRTLPQATDIGMKLGSEGMALAWIRLAYSRKIRATSLGLVDRMISYNPNQHKISVGKKPKKERTAAASALRILIFR